MTTYSRTRSDIKKVTFTIEHNDKDGNLRVYPGFEHISSYRLFRDNPSSHRQQGRYPNTECHDVSVSVNQFAPMASSYDGWWSNPIWVSSPIMPCPMNLIEQLIGDCESRSVYDDALFRQVTLLMQQLPAEVDLGSFIIEARDSLELLPSLVLSWEKFAKGPLVRKNRGTNDRRGPQPPDLSAEGSSNYLAWHMGAVPLISDLEALMSLGKRVTKKLDQLRTKNGRISSRKIGPWSTTVLPVWRPFIQCNNQWVNQYNDLEFRLTGITSELFSSFRLFSRLEGLDDWDGITAAWLAALGLNNPLLVAWNVIPFSFVLDYFAPIGSTLARVGAKPIRGIWDVTDGVWSNKITAQYEIRQRWLPVAGQSYQERIVATAEVISFRRGIEFPRFPFSWPLTARQAGIICALALA